jgi:hypothetical protein
MFIYLLRAEVNTQLNVGIKKWKLFMQTVSIAEYLPNYYRMILVMKSKD